MLCGPSLLLRMIEQRKSSLTGDLQLGNVLVDGSVHELEVNAQVVCTRTFRNPASPFQSTDGCDAFTASLRCWLDSANVCRFRITPS